MQVNKEKLSLEKLSPKDVSPERPRFHQLLLSDEYGTVVARADLSCRNDIVPSYFVEYLEVGEDYQDQGLASKMVKEVNGFLREKKCLGILFNGIVKRNRGDVYLNNSWETLEGTSYMFFNKPSFLTPEDERDLVEKIRKSSKRASH